MFESWEKSLSRKIEGFGDNSAHQEKMDIDKGKLDDSGDEYATVITPEEGLIMLKEKFNKLDEDVHNCEMCQKSSSEICEYHSKKLATLKGQEDLLNMEAGRIIQATRNLDKKPIIIEDDGLNFTPYGDIHNHD